MSSPPSNEWPTHDDILHPAIDEDMNIHQLPGDVEGAVAVGGGEDTFDNEFDGIMTTEGSGPGGDHNKTRRGSTISTAMSSITSSCSSVISATSDKVSNIEPNKKKKIALIGLCTVFLAVIIGLSVGISKRNKSNVHGSGGESLSSKKKPNNKKVPSAYHQDRIEDVFQFVSLYSNKDVLLDEDSPQHKACVWMAVKDELQLMTPTDYYEEAAIIEENSNVHVTIKQEHYRFLQRYLLAVLYYALDGDEWKSRLNFGNNVHECQWYEMVKGKGGGQEYYQIGVQCEDDEHVSGLIIPDNNLKGEIPQQIGYLKELQYMIMQKNSISGTIPNEIAEAKNLNVINLDDNNLSGPLPTTFGRMEQLKILELSNNKISGPLPTEMKKLNNLQTLSLNHNVMDGDILTVLSQISSLQNIYIEHNMFTGTLNNNFQNSPNLIDLVLENNRIGGSLPVYLFEHPTMKTLDLGWNNIQGSIPNPLPENNVLEYLCLAKNELSGNLPQTIYSLSALTHLDVSQNNIGGDIPYDLDKLVHLQYLFIDRNNFNPGEIPEKPFKEMKQLKQLTMGDTGRTGELPPWIAYLEHLTLLDISQHDELTGIGDYYCKTMPDLQLFTVNCDLIENCDCCVCCQSTNDLGCISVIQQKGKKNDFIIPVKSFSPYIN